MNPTDPTGLNKSRSGVWVALVIVLLLGAAGAILYFISRKSEPETVRVTTSASVTTEPATTLDLPPIELPKDAEPDTAPAASTTNKATVGGCPATCTGAPTEALREALSARAGTAKQCYKTAIEGNEGLEGEIAVLVRVGVDGSTCAASVLSDTTGSSRLQQCARSKMIATYPAPKGGCAEVRVPIQFKPQR